MKSKNPNLLLLFLIAFFVGQSGALSAVFRQPKPPPTEVDKPTPPEAVAAEPTPAEQEELEEVKEALKRYDEEADTRKKLTDEMNKKMDEMGEKIEELKEKSRELEETRKTGAADEELQKILDDRNRQIIELQQRIVDLERQIENLPPVEPPIPPPAPPVYPSPAILPTPSVIPTAPPPPIVSQKPITTLEALDKKLREENAFVNPKGRTLHTIPSASFTQLIKKFATISSGLGLAKIIYLAQYIIDRAGLKKTGATRLYKFIDALGKTSPSYHSKLTRLAVVKLRSVLEANSYTTFYRGRKGQAKVDAMSKVLSDLGQQE